MDMIAKTTIQHMIDALEKGQTPEVDPEEIPCFSRAALAENPVVTKQHLEEILDRLSKADLPTLKRALMSLEHDDQAWLGFKVVTDPAACTSDDPGDEDTPISSDWGPSEDGQSCIFFANEGKDIVCSRPWNKRDRFQMLDITRGPSMHKDQFAGVTWVSTPLFATQRVVIYGAGDVSVALARYAHDCGFDTLVVDDDASFLSEERFATSERALLSEDWSNLPEKVELTENDYCVCVSRGHVHDVATVAFSVKSPAAYVGMMGHPAKNKDVFDKLVSHGVDEKALAGVHAPIGIKIADKTPAEIAISIIAELIDVRGKARKQAAANVAALVSDQAASNR